MNKMYFVYVLQSEKDSLLYTGFTENIQTRLARHNRGEVPSTQHRRPLNLIFYEAYPIKTDALRREKYFKTTKGKTALRMMLKDYFCLAGKDRIVGKESDG